MAQIMKFCSFTGRMGSIIACSDRREWPPPSSSLSDVVDTAIVCFSARSCVTGRTFFLSVKSLWKVAPPGFLHSWDLHVALCQGGDWRAVLEGALV